MLALKSELADSDSTTLIFDEIDANIGGETAYLVGKKLQEIGEACQVISITHFPQVAKLARHHLKIFKKEIKGRTSTFIHKLEEDMREEELSRMAGIFS
jgi:DNA repair protein RecN (Recombination protein N)